LQPGLHELAAKCSTNRQPKYGSAPSPFDTVIHHLTEVLRFLKRHTFLKEAYVLNHDEGNHRLGTAQCSGRTHALDGLDRTFATGEVHASWPPTAPASPPPSAFPARLHADSGAAQRWPRPVGHIAVELHRRIAYVPGDVTCGATSPAAKVIDLYAGSAAASTRGAARAGRALELDPTKKGRNLLQGQPPEGRPRRAFASDVDLLILDEPTSGLDPLMEEVFQRCVEGARTGAARSCSRPTSSARSRSCATG